MNTQIQSFTIRITAQAWLRPDDVVNQSATLALYQRNNTPIGSRQIKARTVPLDPGFFPPLACEKIITRAARKPATEPA